MAEGRQGSTSPFPRLLEQGCQRGVRLLRQREAEQAPHPSWGGQSATEETGEEGAKHLLQPWPRGKEYSAAIEGSESKKKKKERQRMMVGGGVLPSIPWPFGHWIGLLPLPPPGCPALRCSWPGTGPPLALELGGRGGGLAFSPWSA